MSPATVTEPTASLAARRAMRAAGRVDRSQISMHNGLIAAVPVAGALAVGTAAGRPAGAVTAAVGAMLSGVAWRSAPGEPPLGTMAAAGAGVALATLAGTLSGRWPWIHLGVLVAFSLVAGLLTALGRRGSVLGIQAVIAFVVFGRFPEPAGPAFALAGLVVLGAGVQIAVAALFARPAAWRLQRGAVATAYTRLAELAGAPEGPTLAVGAALDEAQARLSAPALLADPEVLALANLVQIGRRTRLELGVLGSQLAHRDPDSPNADALRSILARVATMLRQVAMLVDSRGERLPDGAAGLRAGSPGLDPRTDARVQALLGQVAAAGRIAERAGGRAYRRLPVHPSRGSVTPVARFAADLRRLRASATLASTSGRHALRLALVVAGTELLVQRVALPRAYWAVIAAATVLRPEFGATFTRGAERLAGTCAGVVIATLIAVGLQPGGWLVVAIVAVLAWATYTMFAANFAAGIAGLTAMVVFLLHAVAPDSAQIALDRGIDTAIGGAIGLLAYALWPTWSGSSLSGRLAAVAGAQRRYLEAVMRRLIDGRPLTDEQLRPLARRARIVYGDAEAAVTLARSEPVRGTDPQSAAVALAELRRLVFAVHALRIEAAAVEPPQPLPGVAGLAAALDGALASIVERLGGGDSGGRLPPLRACYREALAALPDGVETALGPSLDELVDAIDTVATTAGLTVG